MIAAAVAAGCVGTGPKIMDQPLGVVHEIEPDAAVEAAEAEITGPLSRPTLEPQTGLTLLERIALAEKKIKAEKERCSRLERLLDAEREKYAEVKAKLENQTSVNDKLRRQLVDMDAIIEEVRKETGQMQALRAENLTLGQQLKAARTEISTRKKELLDLTLKLEDIYKVLIKEAEARKKAQEAAQFVGENM